MTNDEKWYFQKCIYWIQGATCKMSKDEGTCMFRLQINDITFKNDREEKQIYHGIFCAFPFIFKDNYWVRKISLLVSINNGEPSK